MDNNKSGKLAAGSQFGRFYLQELINSGAWRISGSRPIPNKPFALRLMHDRYRFNFFRQAPFPPRLRNPRAFPTTTRHSATSSTARSKASRICSWNTVEASNLKELYAKSDPVLLENVAQILIDMATGLEHLHENGYMHLDFKPENVLVTRNAGVRLVDFDLAQPISDEPIKLSKNPGTPAYMAPEQLQQEGVTHRVHILAFGVAA
jgi:serine/threonine-protein kinase